jgi:hypothetical protein
MSARVYVDFNEMLSSDEVLLAKEDKTLDSEGNEICITEGMPVAVFQDDPDQMGAPDRLIADGVAVPNTHGGWSSAAKWVLRIDVRGIRRESDELAN